ncbi:MAG: hypothetical protein MUP98_04470, partial [Candidatus Aminicenantes bacterium]|nr:hypothetical protein [Candidatus Aminicenantes bacterium]
EFFSPPLLFIFPSLLMALFHTDILVAAKLAQFINVLLSLGVTLTLISICNIVQRNSNSLQIASLAFLGILPVYYKSMAFVRGEPYSIFLAVLSVKILLEILIREQRSFAKALTLGICIGLLLLTRQWVFFLLPAMIITVVIDALKHSERIPDYLKMSVVSLMVILIISSWFYIHLFISAGSPMAFNRAAADQLNLSNQPRAFYLGRGSGKLFTDPVRESFPRQFIPIFYSEIWGDYWCYFSVFGWDSRESVYVAGDLLTNYVTKAPEWLTTNRYTMGAYLGRVNLVSIMPTLLAILGFCSGFIAFCHVLLYKGATAENMGSSFFMLLILSSILGYLWFHLEYPVPGEGDTIKATYMLQIFPFIALLTGGVMQRIRRISTPSYFLVLGTLAIVFIHNFNAMLTHYIPTWVP